MITPVTYSQHKPHLLVGTVGRYGIEWTLQCPYEPGEPSPCQLWMECDHREPAEPVGCGEPPRYDYDKRGYDYTGYSPFAAEAWKAHEKVFEEWEDSHPHGSYCPTLDCWAQWTLGQCSVEEALEGADAKGLALTLPFPVEIDNDGGFEDGYLILRPWKEAA